MKRIVRLTESDLVKLVKRVISEQVTGKEHTLYISDTGIEKSTRMPLATNQGQPTNCKLPFQIVGSGVVARNECLQDIGGNVFKINLLNQSSPDFEKSDVAGSTRSSLSKPSFTCGCEEMFEQGSVFKKLGIQNNDTVKVLLYRQR